MQRADLVFWGRIFIFPFFFRCMPVFQHYYVCQCAAPKSNLGSAGLYLCLRHWGIKVQIKARANLRGCVDLSGANRDKRHFVCVRAPACVCVCSVTSAKVGLEESQSSIKSTENTVRSQQATCKWRRPQMPGTRASPRSAFAVNISCHPSLWEGWFMRASHSLIALCARVSVHPRGRVAQQLREASKCRKLPAYFLPPFLPIHSRLARQQEKGFGGGGVGGGHGQGLLSRFCHVRLMS